MLLVECPECEKEVSDEATVCSHCGFPLSRDDDLESAEGEFDKAIQALSSDGEGYEPGPGAPRYPFAGEARKSARSSLIGFLVVIVLFVGVLVYLNAQ